MRYSHDQGMGGSRNRERASEKPDVTMQRDHDGQENLLGPEANVTMDTGTKKFAMSVHHKVIYYVLTILLHN